MKWTENGSSVALFRAFAFALIFPVAGCDGVPMQDSRASAEKAITDHREIQLRRTLTAWYRICAKGSSGNESSVIIWPAEIELKADLRSARVTASSGGTLQVSIDPLQITHVSLPDGLADSMISPIQLRVEKQERSAGDHFRNISKTAQYLATRYFAIPGETQNFVVAEIRKLIPKLNAEKKTEIVFRTMNSGPADIPTFDLCPGSFAMVNGLPILRYHNNTIEKVTDDIRPSGVNAVDDQNGQRPRGNGLSATSTSAESPHGNLLGTVYAIPDFSPLESSQALTKVAGGTRASPGDFPWAVALAVESQPGVYAEYCGGSLIAKNVVLTAGHCTVRSGHVALIGAVDLSDLHSPGVEIISIQPSSSPRGVVPPDYGVAAMYDADLQIVQLESNSAKPVADVTTAEVKAGDRLIAIGWGQTQSGKRSASLMRASLTANTLAACKDHYADNIKQDPVTWGITDHMLCAGGGATATCDGDSGGPLIVGGKIVATVSFGDVCKSNDQAPTLFTRIADFVNFVRPWQTVH